MNDGLSFGTWLKKRRRELDLTQEALAEQVAYSAEMIRKVEAGSLRPSRQLAELLGTALGVPREDQPALIAWARRDTPGQAPGGTAPREGRLPNQPTAFIGREDEIAAARARLLRPEVRLLTLTGAPGIGKTRLALRVAAEARSAFADGVFFVALAAVDDPRGLGAALAEPLGVRELPGRGILDSVGEHLRARQVLLVLDNADRSIEAAPALAGLLDRAPSLKLLVTSRRPLRLRAEFESPVPPLPVPQPASPPAGADALAALAAVPAVALFLARAQAVLPAFGLTPDNAGAVAAICRQLEGLPLSIELAAARIKMLSPAELLGRLESRLTLLTGGPRDAPPHQQTLRAAIAWSYTLLDPIRQRLFARLAVFSGGCTLRAAEAVACAGETAASALDAIADLIDQSLLQRDETGETPRLHMLETLREFGLELLSRSGEDETLRCRHATYYLGLVTLGPDIDNVRLAWRWALAAGELAGISTCAPYLDAFYDMRGWYQEGEEAFAQAVAAVEARGNGEETARLLGRLLAYHGAFLARRARLAEASAALRRSLTLLPAELASRDRAYALNRLGLVVAQQGAYAEAKTFHLESSSLARAGEDWQGIMQALTALGLDAMKLGEYAESRRHLQEALALARELGDGRMVARALNYLGYMLCLAGAPLEARPYLDESLALTRDLDDRGLLPYVVGSHGQAAYALGEYDAARRLSLESLALGRAQGDGMLEAYALQRLGHIAAAEHDSTAALAHIQRALHAALEMGARPRALAALVGLGGLSLAGGDAVAALELLAVPLGHPATEQADRESAERLLVTAVIAAGASATVAARDPARRRARLVQVEASLATVTDRAEPYLLHLLDLDDALHRTGAPAP